MLSILNDALNNWWLAIVFAVGARQADVISTKGQFFLAFVQLIAVITVMFWLTRYIFGGGGESPKSVRFAGLVWFTGAVLSLLGAVVAFMLSRTFKAWSDTEFLGNVLDNSQLITLFAVFLLGVGFVRLLGREHTVAPEHVDALQRAVNNTQFLHA